MRRCRRSSSDAWRRGDEGALVNIGGTSVVSQDRLSEVPHANSPLPLDNQQKNAGWQLRPRVSDSQSTLIGACVCVSLVSSMLIGLFIFWCRRQRRQNVELSHRRNLWAATRWKRGPRNKASFVPLQGDLHQSNWSLWWNFMGRRKRSGDENRLTPFPYELKSTSTTATWEEFQKRGSTCTFPSHLSQAMPYNGTREISIETYSSRLKSRTSLYQKLPPPSLATPEIALPSPHLKCSERMDRGHVPRHSYILGYSLPTESCRVQYNDIMPSKISISETEDSPAGTSVRGLGLHLTGGGGDCSDRSSTVVLRDTSEAPTEETMNTFMRWKAYSSTTAYGEDPSNDVSSIASFELAEVFGVIKPCFTLEKIEEFSGPVYVDQIASALTEAKILPSLSFQGVHSASSFSEDDDGDDGDLSSLFKETMALLQIDITLHRAHASVTRPKTRARARTCPTFHPATAITFDEMQRERKSFEKFRDERASPSRHTRSKPLECNNAVRVEQRANNARESQPGAADAASQGVWTTADKDASCFSVDPLSQHRRQGSRNQGNEQRDKTRQRRSHSSKMSSTIRSSGTDPNLASGQRFRTLSNKKTSSTRRHQRCLTPDTSTKAIISSQVGRYVHAPHQTIASRSPSRSSTSTTTMSSTEDRRGSRLSRAKPTGVWRSSDYHSPTLQVVRLYAGDADSSDGLDDS